MGKRGPAKKPVATLKTQGTFRKDRHSDAIDSELEPCLPPPPPHFDDYQVEVWNRVGEQLAARGLLTVLDCQAFELLVGSYTGLVTTQQKLSEEELIAYVGDQGIPQANPLVNVIFKQINLLKWALTQFGCTPAARTGITPAKRKEASVDPLAQLLGATPPPTKRTTKKASAKRTK